MGNYNHFRMILEQRNQLKKLVVHTKEKEMKKSRKYNEIKR